MQLSGCVSERRERSRRARETDSVEPRCRTIPGVFPPRSLCLNMSGEPQQGEAPTAEAGAVAPPPPQPKPLFQKRTLSKGNKQVRRYRAHRDSSHWLAHRLPACAFSPWRCHRIFRGCVRGRVPCAHSTCAVGVPAAPMDVASCLALALLTVELTLTRVLPLVACPRR